MLLEEEDVAMSDSVTYVEERMIGMKLSPAVVDSDNGRSYFASGRGIFIHDIASGKRLRYIEHLSPVVSIRAQEDSKISTITEAGEYYSWDAAGNQAKTPVKLEAATLPLRWVYSNVDGRVIVAAGGVDSPLVLSSIEDPSSTEGLPRKRPRRLAPILRSLAKFDKRVHSKGSLAVSNDYAILCDGKEVHMLRYAGDSEDFKAPTDFCLKQKFTRGVNDELVVFDSCHIVGDEVYAALTIGRIYIWHQVSRYGLDFANRTFINATDGELIFTVSTNRTIFAGYGNCTIAKWGVATSGIGRWNFAEHLSLEAPSVELCLRFAEPPMVTPSLPLDHGSRFVFSQDETLLAVTLADNSTLIIQTSNMRVLSRAQVINNPTVPPLQWLGISVDPAQPNLIVMNARIGCLQWVDPVRWRTVASLNITQENPTPSDSIDRPDHLWHNPYLVWLTAVSVFTVERRRDEKNKCCMRLFRRGAAGSITDLKMEGRFTSSKPISFIRSNLDELAEHSTGQIGVEEVIRIDEDGGIDVFIRDDTSGGWRADMSRSALSWQRSRVLSCSRVRRGQMATINSFGGCTYLLVWNVDAGMMRVESVIDSLQEAKDVQWTPTKGQQTPIAATLLLVTFQRGIAAYDSDAKCFVWAIARDGPGDGNGMSLFSSLEAVFVRDHRSVYRIDPATASLEKSCEFGDEQAQVTVTGKEGNFTFSGLSTEGLTLMKRDIPENAMLSDVVMKSRPTPFSELAKRHEEGALPSKFVNLQAEVSAKKFLDGPAYTLAPITAIAPVFIRSCLARRREEA